MTSKRPVLDTICLPVSFSPRLYSVLDGMGVAQGLALRLIEKTRDNLLRVQVIGSSDTGTGKVDRLELLQACSPEYATARKMLSSMGVVGGERKRMLAAVGIERSDDSSRVGSATVHRIGRGGRRGGSSKFKKKRPGARR